MQANADALICASPDCLAQVALAWVTAAVSMVDVSREGQPLVFVNAAFTAMTGYPAAEALGRNCPFLQGTGTSPAARRRIRFAVAQRRPTRATLLNYRADGSPFWNELRLTPVQASAGGISHFVGEQRDVTKERERERALLAAGRDELTGLPTRRGLQEALSVAVDIARDRSQSMAIVFVDLDGFKAINDRLGHAAGDRVLAAAAQALAGTVRPSDLLARYGGDEFVLVIKDLEPATARAVTDRICEGLMSLFSTGSLAA